MSATTTHRTNVPRRDDPDVMQWVSEKVPEPRAGEFRVRAEATGVSSYDVMLRGHRFPGFPSVPYTLREDFVGIVDEAGGGVRDPHVGRRVGGWAFGDASCYAEFLCHPAGDFVPVPDALTPDVEVFVIVNYLTASLTLHQASNMKEGDWLLVQGAGVVWALQSCSWDVSLGRA